ncbi:MAG: putative DNA-binding domain-containing protein [Candidatus Berkiella sp.]
MSIYHGSLLGTLQSILATTYPVCCKLVGTAFFRQMAKGFIRQAVHSNPDISSYGENFPQFVHDAQPMHQLCYLADVAALEWACHHALQGP